MSSAMVAAAGAAVAAAAAAWQLDDARLPWRGLAARGDRGRVSAARGGGRSVDRRAGGAGPPDGLRHGVTGVVAACAGLLLGGVVGALIAGAAGLGGSVWHAARRRFGERLVRERAAPALARSLADALRGGASVRGALAGAADDRSVPIGLRSDLTDLSNAVRLGTPVDEALRALAVRGGAGLRLLCGTVVLHLESGGALARELAQLATDGEIAGRIEEDRVAATAQARATVRVVAALPVLALAAAELASRDFLPKIAAQPIALALLLLGFLLEACAIVAARTIVGGRR